MHYSAASSRRKGFLSWMFIRGLIRAYIAWIEVHLCLRAKVPGELIDRLPAVEQILTSTLWFMLVAPQVLENTKQQARPSSAQPLLRAPLILTESELRRRLAKLKAILKDPSGEIARLKAIAAARNIAPAKRAIQRPANLILIPSALDLRHACARAKITPQARPPPAAPQSQNPFPPDQPRWPGRKCWRGTGSGLQKFLAHIER